MSGDEIYLKSLIGSIVLAEWLEGQTMADTDIDRCYEALERVLPGLPFDGVPASNDAMDELLDRYRGPIVAALNGKAL